MKKLNTKGITTIEILVCFVLVVIITVSMYSTVSTYRNKQQIESYKEKIITYKNLLTKEIQDDLIKKGVIAADITEVDDGAHTYRYTSTIRLTFRDGSRKNLIIRRVLARDYDYSTSTGNGSEADDPNWPKQDDYFTIKYGVPGSETEYKIPNLGFGKNNDGNTVLDLRVQNVMVNTNDNVLTIRVDFYHVDLANKYGINIICPINF